METIKIKKITADDVYVSVLKARIVTGENGWMRWEPVNKEAPPTGSLIMDAVARALNANSCLSPEDVAKALGTDTKILSAIFQLLTGKFPKDFFNELRLKKACEWLSCTDIPIKEVAKRSGCQSNTTLTRLFQRELHVTPTKYRELHQPKDYAARYKW